MSAMTIERTGKKWKAMGSFSALACIAGFLTLIGGACAMAPKFEFDTNPIFLGGALGFVGGLSVFIYSRIGAWWHHA